MASMDEPCRTGFPGPHGSTANCAQLHDARCWILISESDAENSRSVPNARMDRYFFDLFQFARDHYRLRYRPKTVDLIEAVIEQLGLEMEIGQAEMEQRNTLSFPNGPHSVQKTSPKKNVDA